MAWNRVRSSALSATAASTSAVTSVTPWGMVARMPGPGRCSARAWAREPRMNERSRLFMGRLFMARECTAPAAGEIASGIALEQSPVGAEMPEGRFLLFQLLVDPRQVVVGVGVAGLAAERGFIGLGGIAQAAEILQSHAEVEGGGGVRGAGGEGLAVVALGFGRLALLVQQPAEVEVGVRKARVQPH